MEKSPQSGVALPAPPSGQVPLGAARTVRMTEQGDASDWQSSARGEQAWKETKERVTKRNAEVRSAGKLVREGYERERASVRQAAAARRDAQLLKRPAPRD